MNRLLKRYLRKLKICSKKVCLNLSGDCIDRTHRTGPDYTCYKSQEKCRSIMVRFVSFKGTLMQI